MTTKKALPIGTLIMVLIVALALLSVGYALWSETLTITGTVYTGEVDVEFSTYPEEECVDIDGIGLCQPEINEYGDKSAAADCTVEWLGPDNDSNGDDGPDQLVVNIVGMYPSWHCKVKFDVTNTGNVPVHVKWPVATTAIPEWVAADFSTCYEENVQLHQGETTGICEIDIHFTNDQAPPEASGPITFGWEILAHQWNELPPPVVSEGPAANFAKGIGDRYRSLGNTGAEENYLGVGDLGVALNRVAQQFTWIKPGTHDITFIFDPVSDTLTSVLNGNSLTYSSVSTNLIDKTDCEVAALDRMEILVYNRDTGTTVNLNNLMLDGYNLGSFVGVGLSTWNVTGFDFSTGFTLTGQIYLDGPFGTSQELSRIEFGVGCPAP